MAYVVSQIMVSVGAQDDELVRGLAEADRKVQRWASRGFDAPSLRVNTRPAEDALKGTASLAVQQARQASQAAAQASRSQMAQMVAAARQSAALRLVDVRETQAAEREKVRTKGTADRESLRTRVASLRSETAEARIQGQAQVKIARETQKQREAAYKTIDRAGQAAGNIGQTMTYGASLPILALGKAALEADVRMDSLKRGLVAVNGSAAAANIQFEKLRQVAKLPGLTLQNAVEGDIQLQAAGVSAAQATRSLMAFGNALATVGKGGPEHLSLVNLALSQIASSSRVSGQDVRQLQEQIPQLRQAMLKVFGTADTIQLGKMGIDPKVFVQKITDELAKLPRVTGGVQNDIENAEDSISQSLARTGQAIARVGAGPLATFTREVDAATSAFSHLSTEGQDALIKVALGVAVGGPLLVGVGRVAEAVTSIRNLYLSLPGVAARAATAQVLAAEGTAAAETLAAEGVAAANTGVASAGAAAFAVGAPWMLAIGAAAVAVLGIKHAFDLAADAQARFAKHKIDLAAATDTPDTRTNVTNQIGQSSAESRRLRGLVAGLQSDPRALILPRDPKGGRFEDSLYHPNIGGRGGYTNDTLEAARQRQIKAYSASAAAIEAGIPALKTDLASITDVNNARRNLIRAIGNANKSEADIRREMAKITARQTGPGHNSRQDAADASRLSALQASLRALETGREYNAATLRGLHTLSVQSASGTPEYVRAMMRDSGKMIGLECGEAISKYLHSTGVTADKHGATNFDVPANRVGPNSAGQYPEGTIFRPGRGRVTGQGPYRNGHYEILHYGPSGPVTVESNYRAHDTVSSDRAFNTAREVRESTWGGAVHAYLPPGVPRLYPGQGGVSAAPGGPPPLGGTDPTKAAAATKDAQDEYARATLSRFDFDRRQARQEAAQRIKDGGDRVTVERALNAQLASIRKDELDDLAAHNKKTETEAERSHRKRLAAATKYANEMLRQYKDWEKKSLALGHADTLGQRDRLVGAATAALPAMADNPASGEAIRLGTLQHQLDALLAKAQGANDVSHGRVSKALSGADATRKQFGDLGPLAAGQVEKLIGLGDDTAKTNAANAQAKKDAADLTALQKQLAAALTDSQVAYEKATGHVDRYDDILARLNIDLKDMTPAEQAAAQAMLPQIAAVDAATAKMRQYHEMMQQVQGQLQNSLANTFEKILSGSKVTFKSVADDFKGMVIRMIAEAEAAKVAAYITGKSGLGGILGGLLGGKPGDPTKPTTADQPGTTVAAAGGVLGLVGMALPAYLAMKGAAAGGAAGTPPFAPTPGTGGASGWLGTAAAIAPAFGPQGAAVGAGIGILGSLFGKKGPSPTGPTGPTVPGMPGLPAGVVPVYVVGMAAMAGGLGGKAGGPGALGMLGGVAGIASSFLPGGSVVGKVLGGIGKIFHFASGTPSVPGNGATDTVPSYLTPGEVVLSRGMLAGSTPAPVLPAPLLLRQLPNAGHAPLVSAFAEAMERSQAQRPITVHATQTIGTVNHEADENRIMDGFGRRLEQTMATY